MFTYVRQSVVPLPAAQKKSHSHVVVNAPSAFDFIFNMRFFNMFASNRCNGIAAQQFISTSTTTQPLVLDLFTCVRIRFIAFDYMCLKTRMETTMFTLTLVVRCSVRSFSPTECMNTNQEQPQETITE